MFKHKEKVLAERGWFKYHYLDSWYSIYTFSRWVAPFATMDELLVKFTKGRVGPYRICVPVRKLGFSEAPLVARARNNHYRMKPFSLSEAISYSYIRDLRFVLVLTLLIGISYWWFSVPEQLLVKPMALQSPDLGLLVNAAKKTFLHHPCSIHDFPSTSGEAA